MSILMGPSVYEEAVNAFKSTNSREGFLSVMKAMGHTDAAYGDFYELLEAYVTDNTALRDDKEAHY